MPVAHSESFGTHNESCGSQGINKDSLIAVNDSFFHDFLLSAHEESFVIHNGLFRALNKSYGANKKLLVIHNESFNAHGESHGAIKESFGTHNESCGALDK